jgi:hypothetical protein
MITEAFKKEFGATLQEFLTIRKRNYWIEVGPVRVYARETFRVLNETRYSTFDIGAVSVECADQEKGYFKATVAIIIDMITVCGIEAVYIENVLNERLEKYLIRDGWTLHMIGGIPSYYKLTKRSAAGELDEQHT